MSPLPSFARSDSPGSLNLLSHDDQGALPPLIAVALTIVSGPGKGAVHRFKKPRIIIGRDVADIALLDPEISRHHCLLEVRDAHIHLRDLDSTNGTFLEDERVRAAVLQDGAEFRIGETVLRVGFEPA
jgi:S-DNA-T family DNA segregation ATPase FtsK/SpoIIIE